MNTTHLIAGIVFCIAVLAVLFSRFFRDLQIEPLTEDEDAADVTDGRQGAVASFAAQTNRAKRNGSSAAQTELSKRDGTGSDAGETSRGGRKKAASGRQADASSDVQAPAQRKTGFDEQLLKVLRKTTLVYFNVNLTANRIVGSIIQQFEDGETVDVLKNLGLEDNCRLTEFVEAWRAFVDKQFLSAYDDFFNIDNLLESYHNGTMECSLIYKTFNARGEDLWAKQTMLLSEEEGTGDILAFVYAHDVTVEMQRKQ